MEGKDLSVFKASLQPYIFPPGVHGCDQTAHGGVSPEWDKSNILPGRHPRPGRLLPEVCNKQRLCVKPPGESRIQEAPYQVPPGSCAVFPISGIELGHDQHEGFTTTRQETADLNILKKNDRVQYHISNRRYVSSGQDELYLNGCAIRSTALSPPATVPTSRQGHTSIHDRRVFLTSEAKDCLRWWSSPPKSGRSLELFLPDQVMATDASLEGWGARLGRLSAQGRWTQAQSQEHINYLELSVVLLALRRWRHQMSQQVISVQMENTAAVAYIVKEGGTQ